MGASVVKVSKRQGKKIKGAKKLRRIGKNPRNPLRTEENKRRNIEKEQACVKAAAKKREELKALKALLDDNSIRPTKKKKTPKVQQSRRKPVVLTTKRDEESWLDEKEKSIAMFNSPEDWEGLFRGRARVRK